MSDTYQGTVEQTPEPDLGAQLSSAWDEAEAKESGDEGPAASAPQAEVAPRHRDEFGRFASVEAPGKGDPAVLTDHRASAADPPTFQPPTSWSPQAKMEFARLSPQMQEAIAVREQQMAEGQAMYQGLRQWVEHAQANGTNLPAVLNDYYNVHQKLATDLVGGLGDLCRYFGHDPVQVAQWALAQAQGYQGGPPQADPTLQYLNQLNQRVEGLYRQNEQAQTQAINSQLNEFAQTHEWYHNLEPIMADVINHYRAMGQEIDLQGAYDAAAWVHPETRQILLNHYMGQGQSNGQAQKSTPSSNRGRSLSPGSPIPGASTKRPSKDSVYEELIANWDELSGV